MKTLETTLSAIAYALQTPQRARLRRNIRGWIGKAIKAGPRSPEWEFVAKWSFELRMLEIR
jgi:hypothetical protein